MLKPNEKTSRFFKELPDHISDSPIKEIIIISNQDVFLKINNKENQLLKPINGVIKLNVDLKVGESFRATVVWLLLNILRGLLLKEKQELVI